MLNDKDVLDCYKKSLYSLYYSAKVSYKAEDYDSVIDKCYFSIYHSQRGMLVSIGNKQTNQSDVLNTFHKTYIEGGNFSEDIYTKTDELEKIYWTICWRTPDFLIAMFKKLQEEKHRMNDQEQAKKLNETGKFAIESENWERLGEVVRGLLDLLPQTAQQEVQTKIGF